LYSNRPWGRLNFAILEAAYTGWPDRLHVIDVDGRVAYKSRPGPFGLA